MWKGSCGCPKRVGTCSPGEQAKTDVPDKAPWELRSEGKCFTHEGEQSCQARRCTCGGPGASLGGVDQAGEGSVWALCWNPCPCAGEAARDSGRDTRGSACSMTDVMASPGVFLSPTALAKVPTCPFSPRWKSSSRDKKCRRCTDRQGAPMPWLPLCHPLPD